MWMYDDVGKMKKRVMYIKEHTDDKDFISGLIVRGVFDTESEAKEFIKKYCN